MRNRVRRVRFQPLFHEITARLLGRDVDKDVRGNIVLATIAIVLVGVWYFGSPYLRSTAILICVAAVAVLICLGAMLAKFAFRSMMDTETWRWVLAVVVSFGFLVLTFIIVFESTLGKLYAAISSVLLSTSLFVGLAITYQQAGTDEVARTQYRTYMDELPDVFSRVAASIIIASAVFGVTYAQLPQPIGPPIGLLFAAISVRISYKLVCDEHKWVRPSIRAVRDRTAHIANSPLEVAFLASLLFAFFIMWYLWMTGYPDVAVPLGGITALLTGIIGMNAHEDSWIREIAPELISISIGIIVIDQVNQARLDDQEKSRVIHQLASPSADFALESYRLVKEREWLYDGSLRGVNLAGANLADLDLSNADLSYADLQGVNLQRANLSRAKLYGSKLQLADLSGANLYQATLQEATLIQANLRSAILYRTNLLNSDMTAVDLQAATIQESDLGECILYYARLDGAQVYGSNLGGALLGAASLRKLRYDASTVWPSGVDYIGAGATKFSNNQGLPLLTPFVLPTPLQVPPESNQPQKE